RRSRWRSRCRPTPSRATGRWRSYGCGASFSGNGRVAADRWQRVESLVHAALARPAVERAAFIADACRDDIALRDEVLSLVAGAGADPAFLETPAIAQTSALT